MKKLIIGATALLLAACGQDAANEPAATAEAPQAPMSGIDLSAMDTSVRPGDDFFAYVNSAWVASAEMPG